MRNSQQRLINTAHIELWPGNLLQARSNHDARLLARARSVLRRKRDGRYLAVDLPEGLVPLVHPLRREPGIAAALDALAARHERPRHAPDGIGTLPLSRLRERLLALGLDESYGERTSLALVAEPTWLALAGSDRHGRPLWLRPQVADAWTQLRASAKTGGTMLDAISGYRSHDYQLGIFDRKLARGQRVDEILTVNAAPGYSEHHSGRALDIGTPGEPAAEESFERTTAFAWLRSNAGAFGFVMSYPRDNPHGIVYEPWHWYWQGSDRPG